jgi:nucleoside-diphosphate-sugar epimerase
MKILIIGGTGYIGSRLFFDLHQKYSIDTIDLEWFGNVSNNKNIKQDFAHIDESFILNYDAIILLAGHSSVGMCIDNMMPTFNNNVRNFCSLLQKIYNILNQKRVKFIYASSSSVYGSCHDRISLESDAFFSPHNYYDLSKQEIDYYSAITKDIEYYSLRFGTVCGWSTNIRNDIMINAMYRSFKDSNKIFCMNQSNYRPILDISDLSAAVETIITKGNSQKRGVYNLVSFNSTIGDIAIKTADELGCELVYENSGGNSIYSFSASNEKFCNTFNFNFRGSIKAIIDSLKNPQADYIMSGRSNKVSYD